MDTTVIVPHLGGVTTALVLFVFACLLYPAAIKNKAQFYAGFTGVLLILLVYSLDVMIRSPGFQVFGGALTGLLQLFSLVMFFMAAGGMSVGELGEEMKGAFEVMRRGESDKTVIIPLSGQMAKREGASETREVVRSEPEEPSRIELPSEGGWPAKTETKRDEGTSIPLE
jgi:hypothetical protein